MFKGDIMGTLIVEKKVTMSQLSKMPKPIPATKWHKPIPHFTAITAVLDELKSRKLTVSELEVGTSHSDLRCFWLAKLVSEGDLAHFIGGRNAHDRSVSYALYGGADIFICSNMMVSAKFSDARKHTNGITEDLAELVNKSLDRVLRENVVNRKRINYYKKQALGNKDAYFFLVDAMKRDILGPSKIKYLVEQWEKPLHEEFSSKNAWSLHKCFTEIFKDLHSADLVYHRNTVLNEMMDDFTGFDKPIIDITPPKKEEKVVEVKPPSLDDFEGNLKENLEVCQEVIVKAKPAPKPKAKFKATKKKAKVAIKKATVTITQSEEDEARSKRVDSMLAQVKKTK